MKGAGVKPQGTTVVNCRGRSAMIERAKGLAVGAGLLLLAGCASTLGRPGGPPPAPASTDYKSEPEQTYTPAGAPAALHADVYLPQGAGPFPAVLLIHGGAWVGGLRLEMSGIARRLAQRGYVAVNIGYRTAPEFHYPAPIEDACTALRWMSGRAEAFKLDPRRIGIWGYSAGAQIGALIATRPELCPVRPAAMVAGGLPADLRGEEHNPFLKEFFGGSAEDLPTRYAQASPIVYVTSDDPPMFLYHGTWDRVIHTDNARRMHEALDRAGVQNQLRLVHGTGHFATFAFGRGAAIEFFDRTLRRR
ncbi:MAG TPA: alpha/beta hydrolase [Candidatus Binatia bacterium]|nr:alpha/beta hydrolase [Candidatus Binatia bacterium]